MAVFVGIFALMGKGDEGATWRGQAKAALVLALILGAALFMVWVNR